MPKMSNPRFLQTKHLEPVMKEDIASALHRLAVQHAGTILLLALLVGISGCNERSNNGKPQPQSTEKTSKEQVGAASWYGPGLQ